MTETTRKPFSFCWHLHGRWASQAEGVSP